MKLVDIIEIVNNPVLVHKNVNLGKCSDLSKKTLESALECKIEWIEGLPNKGVCIYIC